MSTCKGTLTTPTTCIYISLYHRLKKTAHIVSYKCDSLSFLYQETFLSIKAGETQRHSIIMALLQGSATNTLLRPDTRPKLMWNGTRLGLLTIGLRDTTQGEEVGGGTNGDQRSVVYVMLARETRRPMTDLEGGGSDGGGEGRSLRSCSGSNHRITLLLSTFSAMSP